jgi:hypothetical protein
MRGRVVHVAPEERAPVAGLRVEIDLGTVAAGRNEDGERGRCISRELLGLPLDRVAREARDRRTPQNARDGPAGGKAHKSDEDEERGCDEDFEQAEAAFGRV